MADTISTAAQLLTQFADNVTKNIHPQQSRNLVVSLFGYTASFDPDNTCDSVDTAGLGAFFDTGSRWTNYASNKLWQCESGAANAAVWRLIWPQFDTAYIDAGDAATLAAAETYADAGDASTLSSAQTYSDAGDASTLSSAHSYADAGDASTLSAAESYAASHDATTLASAESYADTHDATTLASAESYADTHDAATLAAAEAHSDAYTDAAIAALPGSVLVESGASEKISAMASASTPLAGSTVFPVLVSSVNKTTTLTDVINAVVLALSTFFYTYGGTPGPSPGPGGALDNNYGSWVLFTDPYEYGLNAQDVESGGGSFV
jgi:hypothetical protein